MKLNEYQQQAMTFAKYTSQDYPFLALSEEVGEVMGKLAKFNRKNDLDLATSLHGCVFRSESHYIELRAALKKELGDVLWQLQACCNELGFTLEELAQENINKLSGRENRGTIVGEGDER